LVLFIMERISMHIMMGMMGQSHQSYISSIFVTVIFLFAFINAIRGTFAYHRMQNAGTSDREQHNEVAEPKQRQ
jgi:hypothetical protein